MKALFIKLFGLIVEPKVKTIVIKDGECEYDTENEIVYIALNDIKDCGFLNHLKHSHNYENNYPLILWSILHEIGHYHTIDDCDGEEDYILRTLCNFEIENEEQLQNVKDIYFNLETEWEATEWAIDYVENHKILCKIFSKIL